MDNKTKAQHTIEHFQSDEYKAKRCKREDFSDICKTVCWGTAGVVVGSAGIAAAITLASKFIVGIATGFAW